MILFADTNILLDLYKIDLLVDFLHAASVYIEESIFEDELIEPKDIQRILISNGLARTAMDDNEFTLARSVYEENPKLSFYDSIAFAVAKCRGWDLLTGDKRLRKYAELHGVKVYGLLCTVRLCEAHQVDMRRILCALQRIDTDSRIRVPKDKVWAMKIGVIIRFLHGKKKYMDYQVNIKQNRIVVNVINSY